VQERERTAAPGELPPPDPRSTAESLAIAKAAVLDPEPISAARADLARTQAGDWAMGVQSVLGGAAASHMPTRGHMAAFIDFAATLPIDHDYRIDGARFAQFVKADGYAKPNVHAYRDWVCGGRRARGKPAEELPKPPHAAPAPPPLPELTEEQKAEQRRLGAAAMAKIATIGICARRPTSSSPTPAANASPLEQRREPHRHRGHDVAMLDDGGFCEDCQEPMTKDDLRALEEDARSLLTDDERKSLEETQQRLREKRAAIGGGS